MGTVTPGQGQVPEVAPEVVLRPGRDTDIDYVYSTWLRSYLRHGVGLGWARHGGPEARARYHRGQQAVIRRILDRGARVTVAGLAGDEQLVCGWAVDEPYPRILHYVYVRQTLQRCGIGRQLLQHVAPTEHTHRCRAPRGQRGRGSETADWLEEWIRREWPLAQYNPYAVNGG